MIYAPLVMPEVILGLSLLLLFVAIGLDARLLDHRHRAHDLRHVLRRPWWCSRGCVTFDRSLEEAAHGPRRAAAEDLLRW